VLVISGCSGQHQAAQQPAAAPPSTAVAPSSTAQPQDLKAAIAAAQEKADRHTAGDFAGEWLLFTNDLRTHLTQQAFTEFSDACSNVGLKIAVTGGRMDGPDRAIVRQELHGAVKAATMAYEDGGWYKVPDDFLTANYGKTGAEIIAVAKTQGECSKQK
jgi:hypothetical protein